jgi:hypothetical protein
MEAETSVDSPSNSQRYARELLERLGHSLALALMHEAAAQVYAAGDDARVLTATRYYEEIEGPKLGAEGVRLQHAASELLEDEHSEVNYTAVPAQRLARFLH